ncbi:DNA-directed RNA polymerase I subunit RPA43 [Gracilariopsis chorda]|uniref:DNA-directed RNA polymerase I subunit RPA43 n=1 Tax=Gracilariopsis chorda TaxID=448386 RepID=A0A2V3J1F4_9FLOR|nr:DNA-directed RNA polymerase I subunit RPA43 [Gracilariopsis chorda]|eukprot:PXF48246.1 DNA-directed RNA polymerase I subunit RPA43 [Gracilariopsis chorda]
MPSPPLSAVWRQVEARVHISLSPSQLSDPLASATHVAFDNLLMRYNQSLKGVVVAHIAPLKLLGHPTFIDASPFAHVAARAKLLVFNPPPGSVLVGVVKHVGPDHLGLTVFRNFHAVLPLHSVANMFQYDGNHPRKWRRSDQLASPSRDVIAGKQIRFVVHETKATKEGLFQILASLDDRKCTDAHHEVSLGLLASCEEIPGQITSPHEDEERYDVGAPNVDVLNVRKRSSIARAGRSDRRSAGHLLLGGDDVFGDVLAPVQYDAAHNDHENTTTQEDVPNGQITEDIAQPTPEQTKGAPLSTAGLTAKPEGSTFDGEDAVDEVTTPAAKEHRKRHKHGDERQDSRASTPKRRKKKRHSDSFMEVDQAEDKFASPSSHLALTERKKKKKSKDKERRKDRDKDKHRKSDKKKDKHGHKHKHKVKRTSEGREANGNARGTQESDPPKSSQEREAIEKTIEKGKSTNQLENGAGDRVGDSKGDKIHTKPFLSNKYENALEAVNVAPLTPSPRKKDGRGDGRVGVGVKEETREHGSMDDGSYDPVKTQIGAQDVGTAARSVSKKQKKVPRVDSERENGEGEKSQRSEERDSVIKKRKRKRERAEVDDSGKKKKKKRREKREAKLVSPTASARQSSLADTVSRGLARRWQAR